MTLDYDFLAKQALILFENNLIRTPIGLINEPHHDKGPRIMEVSFWINKKDEKKGNHYVVDRLIKPACSAIANAVDILDKDYLVFKRIIPQPTTDLNWWINEIGHTSLTFIKQYDPELELNTITLSIGVEKRDH